MNINRFNFYNDSDIFNMKPLVNKGEGYNKKNSYFALTCRNDNIQTNKLTVDPLNQIKEESNYKKRQCNTPDRVIVRKKREKITNRPFENAEIRKENNIESFNNNNNNFIDNGRRTGLTPINKIRRLRRRDEKLNQINKSFDGLTRKNEKMNLIANNNDNNNLDNIILDTGKAARDEQIKNKNKFYYDEINFTAGNNDSNKFKNNETTNLYNQQYAKKQITKAKIINKATNRDKREIEEEIIRSKTPTKFNLNSKNLIFMYGTSCQEKFNMNSTSKMNNFYFQRSNIFNDPQKDIQNKNLKPNIKQKEKRLPVTPEKKNYNQNKEAILINNEIKGSSWNHLTEKEKNINKLDMDAKERKLIDMKGNFPSKFSDYKPSKIEPPRKSIDEERENNLKKRYKNISEENRQIDNFTINVKNPEKFDMNRIKKIARDNGLHIYGDKFTCSVFDNDGFSGKANFKIRSMNSDKNYNDKIEKITKSIQQDQGITIERDLDANKKENDKVQLQNYKNNRIKNREWAQFKAKQYLNPEGRNKVEHPFISKKKK